MKMVRGVVLERLRDDTRGHLALLGLDPRGESDYLGIDMTGPIALVVGNEAFGIVEEEREFLDSTIYIRMPGLSESLNVASAAAVVLFEALRQRDPSSGGD